MDTTGWMLKDLLAPLDVMHAHPLQIVKTEAEATARGISRWHVARTVHSDSSLHAYYNSFNPLSTRWHPDNKGDASKGIIANLTADQRKQVILNAQAAHNNQPLPVPGEPQSPVYGGNSDDLPPVPATPSPEPVNVPTLPKPQNGTPSPDALTALIEEQAKMSALALKATVDTRNTLNGHITGTTDELATIKRRLTETERAYAEQVASNNSLVARIDEIEQRTPRQTVVTIREPGKEDIIIRDGRHKVFPKIVAYSKALREGTRGIWLTGGAGTGKTTLAMHVAEATGRQFRLQGAVTAKHDLVGYMDAQGRYVGTPFRDAFENGHLCLLDEVDASFPAGTLAIQAAVSNKVCQFPDRAEPVVMHPNFILFCAANTTGQGSDALYSGRTKQDAAFLDRFTKVHVDYDQDWELSATPASMKAFTEAVHQVRANVSSARTPNRNVPNPVQGAGAQIIISIRSIFQGIDLVTGTDISAVEIMDDIYRTPYGNVNTFDTLFAPVYAWAREFDRKNNRGQA